MKPPRSDKTRSNRGSAAALPWTIRDKLAPQVAKVAIVPRAHLLATIHAHIPGAATLLRAPPGFGKTFLAALVHESLKSKKWACAWLTIGKEHRSTEVFRQDVRRALSHANVNLGAVSAPLNSAPENPAPENAVMDAIERARRPTSVVLDGIEHLAGADSLPCVARLVERIPMNAHFLLTSRRAATLNVSRQQAAGELLELGADVLRFGDDETGELLRGFIDRSRLDEFMAILNGWPVAVQLARQSLQRSGGEATIAAVLAGGPAALARYTDQQVLGPLSAETQQFLACAAELRAESAEVVDAARGRRDRYHVQAEVAELDPLIRLDADAPSSLHTHPAISARLRNLQMPPESRRDIHRRAADWLTERGDAPGAIEHLVCAGDVTQAANLLERTGLLALAGDLGTAQLNSLLRHIPASALSNLPRARLVWIATQLNDGRREEATAEFQRAQADAVQLDAATRGRLEPDVLLLREYFDLAEDRFPSTQQLEQIHREAASVAGTDPTAVVWPLQRGQFRLALANVENLAGILSRMGFPFDAACEATYRGMIAFALGDLEGAARAHVAAAGFDPGVRVSLPSLLVDIPFAELHYERDALRQAGDLLARHGSGRELLEESFDVFLVRVVISARLLQAEAKDEAALRLLRNEAATARSRGLLARWVALMAATVEFAIQAGAYPEAIRAGQELPGDLSEIGELDTLPWRLIDLYQLARARLALAAQDAELCVALTRELIDRWDGAGLVRGAIRARIVAAAGYTRLGIEAQSGRCILEALELSLRTGHVRVLLDERSLLAALFASFSNSAAAGAVTKQIREWMAHLLKRLTADDRKALVASIAPLSARERDVLVGLSKGHTNKMIASACRISENTVKHHLRRVYRKLKVKRRVQAVDEARRRSLIL
jgi:LuxR family transcriptional regulator, maltose regulon positive regulatory protein